MSDFFVDKYGYFQLGIIIVSTYLGMKYLFPVIAPFLIAGLVILFIYPKFRFLKQKLHIKKRFLAAILLLFLFALLAGGLWLIGGAVVTLFTQGVLRPMVLLTYVETFIHECCMRLGQNTTFDGLWLEQQIWRSISQISELLQSRFLPGLMGESMVVLKAGAGLAGFIGVTIVAMLLMAKDYGIIGEKLLSCKSFQGIWEVGYQVVSYIKVYVKAQLILMLVISITCSIVLWLSDIKGGIWLGVLTGFLDMLPFIGSGLVLIPLGFYFLLSGFYGKAIICFLLYGFCAMLRELLEPKLIGSRVGLWPVAILFGIYAGIKLFGLSGIIKGPIALVIICETCNYLNR